MSSTQSSDPLVGQTLDDRYEIVRRLARGGMATVYLADDLRLSRVVAIKIMHEGLGDDEDFSARFDAEARAAAHLAHANVVSVFDQGNDLGRPYIVMEYVQGATLRQLITREAPMDPLRALELIEPVVSALAAAHSAGMIHRDVKPENVLISDRGQIKVADFGLARAVTANSHAASTGLVIGTVSYIAPELVTRGRADARSDVYSTAIVLYEMLTGVKPHTGDNPVAVAYSHVHNQIGAPSAEPSTAWRASGGIPDFVDELVMRAGSRERTERPEDAGVLLEHIRAARTALAHGVTRDRGLVDQVRQTAHSTTATTARVATLVGAGGPAPEAARGRELRFTPSTPVSPSFEVYTDGAPYYPDTPVPPDTGTVPAVSGGRRRRNLRWLWLLLGLVLAFTLSLGGWWLVAGRYVPAPQLAGMNQPEAVAEASASGLEVTFANEYSEDVPVGQVTRTDPGAGENVVGGGTMHAWLSRGPERFGVPKLVGLQRDAAGAALTDTSLVSGTVTETFDDKVAAGVVMSQDPDAGERVKRDTPVAYVVSKGPAPVPVADWTNKKYAEAKATLTKAGLKVTAKEENSDTVAKGLVISQNPGAGELKRGDSVSFVLSKGPVMVRVPNVRGLGATAARAKLEAAGFQVRVTRVVNSGLGLALRTSPASGSLAPKGSTLTLYLV